MVTQAECRRIGNSLQASFSLLGQESLKIKEIAQGDTLATVQEKETVFYQGGKTGKTCSFRGSVYGSPHLGFAVFSLGGRLNERYSEGVLLGRTKGRGGGL